MNRLFIITLLIVAFFSSCAVLPPFQRSRLIAIFHLIEISNYPEAKKVADEMIEDKKASQWPRTWYARGLLCQTAYQEGMRRNNRRMFELYPDQLYVAYESYEKALELDTKNGIARLLAPKYVLLANDFKTMGTQHFNGKRYEEALRAFDKALKINESSILTAHVDTNLIYNIALAALESKKKDIAIQHLERLDEYNYSTNVSHLLSATFLEKGDTLSAEKALSRGIKKYEDNEGLILLLADLQFSKGDKEQSLQTLTKAHSNDPDNYIYLYTKGLIYQKTEQYKLAISTYEEAIELAPDESKIYTNIATCYYNIGIEIEENSRLLTSNREVAEKKEKSKAAFEAAALWLNKASEKGGGTQANTLQLQQRLNRLNITFEAADN
jgi:tetratricopeptide (TPR) repeat protein